MIYQDLHQWIVDRLNGDAYINPGVRPCLVLAQDHPDTPHLVQKALNSVGVVAIVAPPSLKRTGGIHDKEFMATLPIVIIESPKLNHSTRGSGKSAWNLAVKSASLCEEQKPYEWWAPLMFTDLSQTECEDELVIWVVEIQTRLMIDILSFVLSDQDGNVLTDQDGNPLEVSPTDP